MDNILSDLSIQGSGVINPSCERFHKLTTMKPVYYMEYFAYKKEFKISQQYVYISIYMQVNMVQNIY
jgi:hypothetical protein